MAEYKNQHFVPRIHLKPFSDRGEGKGIGLYTSKVGRYVHAAPLSSQCSRDYFYGRDRALELNFGELESHYANRVRQITDAGPSRSALSSEWMQLFWCAQWARTEAAAEQARSMAAGLAKIANHAPLAAGPEEDRWVLVALSAMSRAHKETADLAYVILRNRTDVPFVTSDNPAVIANRLHAVKPRLTNAPAGLGSAGAILLLPLTPLHAVMWYDAAVHNVAERNGWLNVTNSKDIDAINQHQILNCMCNVYFSSATAHEWIEPAFMALNAERQKPRWKLRFGVPDGGKGGVERYRFIDGGRTDEHPRGIIMSWAVARLPTLWPSFLRWRHRGVAFDTGTGAGVVRRAYVEANPLQRVRAIQIDR